MEELRVTGRVPTVVADARQMLLAIGPNM